MEHTHSLPGYDSRCCSCHNESLIEESIDSGTSTAKIDYQYPQCARRGCQKLGNRVFEIKYTNMVGYFCNSCSSKLNNLGLVVEDSQSFFHPGMKNDSRNDNDKIQ